MNEQAVKDTHAIWHKFSKWLAGWLGKDLYGEWCYIDTVNKKYKYRNFNELELSRRLVGYEVMEKVEKYVKRHCPQIKVVCCDDSVYAGSLLLLIPHPSHGITILFIPQCTTVQNQFFLYANHFKQLIDALQELKSVYTA